MKKDAAYDRSIFARELTAHMDAAGESRQDIARLLGVSRSNITAYCAGTQLPRMDKIEQLARHFGVSASALLYPQEKQQKLQPVKTEHSPADEIYASLNELGQEKFLHYGELLRAQKEFRAAPAAESRRIPLYIVPAAAGYASPIEGEDFEIIELPDDAPRESDFCIRIQGDSMEPYIPDGSLVFVRRNAELQPFEPGIFFVDGDVFCKQWCRGYDGTLYLLSANPHREDANIEIRRDSGRTCICFGKVLLNTRLPEPIYR